MYEEVNVSCSVVAIHCAVGGNQMLVEQQQASRVFHFVFTGIHEEKKD